MGPGLAHELALPPLKAAFEDETHLEALRNTAASKLTNLRTPGAWFDRVLQNHNLYHSIVSGEFPPVQIEARLEHQIESDFDRYGNRKKQELAVADYIESTVIPTTSDPRFEKIVAAMRACHDVCSIYHCEETGERRYAWDAKCNQSKLCPHDARLVANELTENKVPAFEYLLNDSPGRQLQFWVLAPPNVEASELAEQKRALFLPVTAMLTKLRHEGVIVGSFVTQEDPLAADRDRFNVHFNVLVIVERGFVPWAEIRKQLGGWSCRFQDQRGMLKKTVLNLRRRGQGLSYLTPADVIRAAVIECVKYSAKLVGTGKSDPAKAPPMVEWPPDRWLTWFYANLGFRRIRTYGALNAQVKYSPTEKPRATWPVIGSRIRRARVRMGWDTLELARQLVHADPNLGFYSQLHVQLLGWEAGTVQTDENEDRVRPPSEHVEALLAQVLCVDVHALYHMAGASVYDLLPEKEPDTRVWLHVGSARFDRIDRSYRPFILIKAPKSKGELLPHSAQVAAGDHHCLDPPPRRFCADDMPADYSDPSGQWS